MINKLMMMLYLTNVYSYNFNKILPKLNRNNCIKMYNEPSYVPLDIINSLAKSSSDLDKWNILDFMKEATYNHIDSVTLLKKDDIINGLVAIDNLYNDKPDIINLHYLETGISKLNDLVIDTLYKNNIFYSISNLPNNNLANGIGSYIFNFILIYILFNFIISIFGKNNLGGNNFINPFNPGQIQSNVIIKPEDCNTLFTDVAGCDEAKLELQEIVNFLKNPDIYNAAGAKIPKGILLEGPPGTGKTLLARAVAGESNVTFLQISASEFVQMYVGVGASRVRELFKTAKENTPCVIFIDEIDAIGRHRSDKSSNGGGSEEREQTLNQILTNMDGFDKTDSIVVMAATNRIDILDSALTRSGRFDRKVTIPLPDKDGRRKIIDIHLRNKLVEPDTDLEQMAALTSGFSGADIENMANEAVILALRENKTYINLTNLVDAFEKIAIGLPQTSRNYNKIEKQTVAYHEAGHAITALLFKEFFDVRKVTIVSNSNGAGGYTLFTTTDDYKNYPTKKYILAQMIVTLGGRAAEIILHSKILKSTNPSNYNLDIVFNNIKDLDISTGASGDLKQADLLARTYIELFGIQFNDTSTTIQTPNTDLPFMVLSELTKSEIDLSISIMINYALKKAIEIIDKNLFEFTCLATDLIAEKSLGSDYLKYVNVSYFY